MNSEHVSEIARLYADARGITLSTLGTYVAADGKFFRRLSEGRVTIRRAEQILQRLSNIWPDEQTWPTSIPRPMPQIESEEVSA